MYDGFYKLTKKPFQLNADTEFFFTSDIHQRALTYMHYGLTQGEGFIVITGRPGTGKTLLVKQMVNTLKKNQLVIGVIVSSQLDADNLLKTISATFELKYTGLDKTTLLAGLERFFIDQAMQGKKVLLMVDEAQNLSKEALEELRMLSNFEMSGKPLFQTFLIGQNQLAEKLFLPEMDQLRQRIVATCQIKPFTEQETKNYIFFRLEKAGWRQSPEFTDDAFPLIHAYSQGIPRRINTLCDRALLFGYISELTVIDANVIQQVIDDIEEERLLIDDEEPASLTFARTANGGRVGQQALSEMLRPWLHGTSAESGQTLEQRVELLEQLLAGIRQVLNGG